MENQPETPESPESEEVEKRDSFRRRAAVRDERGRIVRGHVPGSGRPIEISYKARKAFSKIKGFNILSRIAENEEARASDRIRALEVILERGYGKALDVQALLHFHDGETTAGQALGLTPGLLTNLARQLQAQASATTPRAPDPSLIVDGQCTVSAPQAPESEPKPPESEPEKP